MKRTHPLSCALLSCWLILLRWSLMGDAVSHAVLPVATLSFSGARFLAVSGDDIEHAVGEACLLGERGELVVPERRTGVGTRAQDVRVADVRQTTDSRGGAEQGRSAGRVPEVEHDGRGRVDRARQDR